MLAFTENLAQNMRSGMPPVCTRTAPLTLTGRKVPIMANDTIAVLVYKITCLATGRAYIGITSRGVQRRWREHRKESLNKRNRGPLYRAIRKHGVENFVIETLYEAVDVREACTVERGLISAHATLAGGVDGGFNLTTGGELTVGRRVSLEGRRNLSNAVKAQWRDPEFRARALAAMAKRPEISLEHKEHLRALAANMKGKPRRAESIEKGRQSLMGHVVSAETRAKIGAAHKGKNEWWTEERRQWRSEKTREAFAAGAFDHLDYSAIARERAARPEVKEKQRASWTPERKRIHSEKIRLAAARRREAKEKSNV